MKMDSNNSNNANSDKPAPSRREYLSTAEAAKQLGVSQDVRFSGPLFGQDKWMAYRDADVFVLPSQNENFGNTAAEAVAAGTPVIVTEQCGIAPLLASQAGLVVKHGVHELAEALSHILTDDKLHRHLQSGCAKVASDLGWGGPIREMESLYGKCVSRKGRSGEDQQVG